MLRVQIKAVQLAELAGRNATFEWRLRSADFQRLGELAAVEIPESAYGLTAAAEFSHGSEGFPVLHLVVAGNWPLVCQRCLSGVVHAVDIDGVLTVLPGEGDAEHLADPFDCVVIGEEGFTLLDVLEDEVLAALPIAPVHEPAGECKGDIDPSMITDVTNVESTRPFAGLADLIETKSKDRTGKSQSQES